MTEHNDRLRAAAEEIAHDLWRVEKTTIESPVLSSHLEDLEHYRHDRIRRQAYYVGEELTKRMTAILARYIPPPEEEKK